MSDEKQVQLPYYTYQVIPNLVKINMFIKNTGKAGNSKSALVSSVVLSFVLFTLPNITIAKEIQSKSAPTLKQVLAAVMSRSEQSNSDNIQSEVEKTSWLASSPKLGMSYLKSDLQQGTDEAEISINLPMKSWLQNDIDNKLYASSRTTQMLLRENKRLALSGIIREQLWQIKLANNTNKNLNQKLNFITDLESQYQQLFQNAALNHYPLLLIKKEKIDSQIAQLTVEQTINQLHQQYTLLSGFSTLPTEIDEQVFENNTELGQLLTNHPEVKKLDQDWLEQQQQLTLASNQVEPWNLSFNAINLSDGNINETQIGIAAEVPLTIFDIKSQASNSEWLSAKGNYDLNRASLLISLQNTYLSIRANQQVLLKQQDLLLQAKSLSKQIIAETQLLIEANQIDQDIAIRRMLSAFNTKAKLTTNQLLLLKNSAALNQAAGISL